ncbi:siderophore-interacting protein [Actinomadura sp. NAK00032]|uniref:siderophore-interacting protein n=1 Tax=Actinomadura sp. NAK00032 TaxID=2742128 RepID=UPI0015929D3F|nr:siderophore-interacting protein [Actinomadura sp. NAK00032]QKW39150.1 siderophore-interacting protein [Actinomadura sp. NAK00032]
MARNPLSRLVGKYALESTVAETADVTPTMRRIRLVAEAPIPFPYAPGQHVRIQINDPLSVYGLLRPVETLRTYTIWDFDRDARTLELRAHLYDGDGIGLRWARGVRPGDPVTFWWPQGDFFVRDAAFHVFVGDETASAAFGPMLRSLDASARVCGVLESETGELDPPLPGPHRLERVHREGAPAASSALLLDAVARLDLPDGEGAAYVAGEARTCQMVRDHLVRDRGWPRTSIKVKPFWTPGKRGLH